MNYKINQIKRLIESLDPYEIRELTDYLMEEVDADINDLNLDSKKYLSSNEIEEIAEKIENRELPETKELLVKTDIDGLTVAHVLAYHSDTTNWSTNDKEILMMQDR